MGDLECSFKVLWDGVSKNLGEAPASLEVQLNESASASWTLTIIDPTGDYHPRKAGSEWEEWMDDAAYDESGNIIKKLVAVVDWGGVEWTFVGVPVAFGHTRNKQSQRLEFKWTGLDVSAKLFRRSQTLDTIRADRRSRAAPMLRTVLGQIASAYDVDADWGLVDNQPVRTMHMQDGRPGDWMQQLLEAAPFAEWKVRGETLIGFQPTVKSAPDWVYDRHACVEEEFARRERGRHDQQGRGALRAGSRQQAGGDAPRSRSTSTGSIAHPSILRFLGCSGATCSRIPTDSRAISCTVVAATSSRCATGSDRNRGSTRTRPSCMPPT